MTRTKLDTARQLQGELEGDFAASQRTLRSQATELEDALRAGARSKQDFEAESKTTSTTRDALRDAEATVEALQRELAVSREAASGYESTATALGTRLAALAEDMDQEESNLRRTVGEKQAAQAALEAADAASAAKDAECTRLTDAVEY